MFTLVNYLSKVDSYYIIFTNNKKFYYTKIKNHKNSTIPNFDMWI